MMQAVSSALTTVIQWIGTVLDALLGESGALAPVLPLLAVGVAVSAVFMVIRIFRSFAWGT